MSRIPVHIDVDTGTDDAIALLCALMSEDKIDILSFSAVAGNAPLDCTTKNTLDIADMMGNKAPVAIGAAEPLIRDLRVAISHGKTGLGNVVIPSATRPFSELSAYDQIYESACKADGELIYLGTGPQTNLALALKVHPDLKDKIKRVVLMGGSLIGGNTTQTSEFNAYVDPEAMKIVMRSGIPTTMVGLDVTLQTELPVWVIEELRKLDNKYAKLAVQVMDFMLIRNKEYGFDVANIHDALAFCAIVYPEVIKTKKYFIDVATAEEMVRGMTVADFRDVITDKEPNVDCAEEVDVQGFWNWMVDLFKSKEA
ncbi:MAG: nucleoside hydrolase [Hespellia sp.]|nr:nucleoside hydrolase [Hespellia sp.]